MKKTPHPPKRMHANEPSPPPPAADSRSWQRGFWSLFITQFQGAFSDNMFKFLVIFLIIDQTVPESRDSYISVVLAVFSLPFILFSMTGGFLADRYAKRSIIIGTKAAEVGIMVGATLGYRRIYSRIISKLATKGTESTKISVIRVF